MSEHTPGPWEAHCFLVVAQKSKGCSKSVAYAGREICHTGEGRGPSEESEANARLIAASPDLLAACEAFIEAWDKSHQLEKTDVAMRLARAAITRAKGAGK